MSEFLKIEEGKTYFIASTEGWVNHSGATVTITGGRLKVTQVTAGAWATIKKTVKLQIGKAYKFSFDFDPGTATAVNIPVYNNAVTTYLLPVSGFAIPPAAPFHQSFTFIATDTAMWLFFEMPPSNPAGAFYYLDNAILEEVVPASVYGFNGQERDDEVSGAGNSYTAEFWQYDPRLGRRWNVDPEYKSFPWESPYATFGNSPIINSDVLGDKFINGHEKDKKDAQANVDKAQKKLDNKQKAFDEKYKDIDPAGLKGKELRQYERDRNGVSKARNNRDFANDQLNEATAKYDAVEQILQGLNDANSKVYSYWDKLNISDQDVEIEVTVETVPRNGSRENTSYVKRSPLAGVKVVLQVSPGYRVTHLSLNVSDLAHGLGHAWTDWHPAIMNGSEENANKYEKIVIEQKDDPRKRVDEFEKP